MTVTQNVTAATDATYVRTPDIAAVEAPPDIETVPFVDLGWMYDSLRSEIDAAIAGVLGRSDFVLGPSVREFESEFARYCGVSHAVGVDSGFSALELALRAYGIGPGDEVITPANTFVATVGAIEASGAIPVLVDIDARTLNVDPGLVAAAITPATRAIIPVHLYGRPAPMDDLVDLAAEHDLVVIEDACQAHGARYGGRRVGGWGHAAAFSFYPAKNLGALGDGGMIVTEDDAIAEELRKMRNLGSTVKYRHEIKGFNRRLDTLHAAVLKAKLPHLDAHNGWRLSAANDYIALLDGSPIVCPAPADPETHVYHLFVIQTPQRDELQVHLEEEGISTGVHYPIPIHRQPAYGALGSPGAFPVTEKSAKRILSLPMYPGITSAAVEKTANAIQSFYNG